jgi:hypothetical protein
MKKTAHNPVDETTLGGGSSFVAPTPVIRAGRPA